MTYPLQTAGGDEIRVTYYPDQTPIVTARQKIDTLVLRPTNLGEFMGAMFWCDAQRWRGTTVRHLVLPLMPGSRQDRMNATGDALFSVKSFAEMINARQFEHVSILDPHSDVTPALVNNVRIWEACDVIEALTHTQGTAHAYDAIIAPDAGALKRATRAAHVLNVPVIHATKTRDLTNGAITRYELPALSVAKHYLVVDDICDGGATFLALKDAAPEATIDLYVTHGLFTHGTTKLLRAFGRIYCSDSVLTTRQYGVTILPIVQRMCDHV